MKDRKVGSIEIHLDERLQRSFIESAPSGESDGAFDLRGVLPLTITL